MDRPRKIISCEVLRNEVEKVNPGYEVDFFEGALHDYPDRMRAAIQERIDATEGEREHPPLLRPLQQRRHRPQAGPHRLVLPAVDDCISLVLGSREAYLEEHRRAARHVLLHARVDRLHRRPVQGVPQDRPQVR